MKVRIKYQLTLLIVVFLKNTNYKSHYLFIVIIDTTTDNEETVVDSIAKFMAHAHESVNNAGLLYRQNDRR